MSSAAARVMASGYFAAGVGVVVGVDAAVVVNRLQREEPVSPVQRDGGL